MIHLAQAAVTARRGGHQRARTTARELTLPRAAVRPTPAKPSTVPGEVVVPRLLVGGESFEDGGVLFEELPVGHRDLLQAIVH